MTNYAVCTSWNESGRALYGERFVGTFVDHWPNSVRMFVYEEGNLRRYEDERVVTWPMPDACERWKARHRDEPIKNGRIGTAYSFKHDAIKFCNKVYVIQHAMLITHGLFDMLIWMDGDIVTHAAVDEEWLEQFVPGADDLCSYLGRDPVLENGFTIFNLRHPDVVNFVDSWVNAYENDSIFRMERWDDSYTLQVAINAWAQSGYTSRNIGDPNARGGAHVFVQGGLGERMDHMKGQRKNVGHSGWEDISNSENANLDYWKKVKK